VTAIDTRDPTNAGGVSQRLGHATIAITMDTCSHVIPGLDEQAAETEGT
jgi:hypothetical protein